MIATLKGVSQVTFVENWKTGVFWVVGLTLAFQIPPLITGATAQNLPWWTNGYTAQWDQFSPLFLAGAMALLGSGIGVTLAILNKIPTAEIRLGLHGFNQVLVMMSFNEFPSFNCDNILLRSICNDSMLCNSHASSAEVLWNMGLACSHRAFCIYCMGIHVRRFWLPEYSGRYRMEQRTVIPGPSLGITSLPSFSNYNRYPYIELFQNLMWKCR